VAPDRLRFDFAHFSAVTREQWLEIEAIVNARILENTTVTTEVRTPRSDCRRRDGPLRREVRRQGARGVGARVQHRAVRRHARPRHRRHRPLCDRVRERRGAGVRRIEATTGAQSLRDFQAARETLGTLSGALNAAPAQLAPRVAALQDEVKRLGRDLQQAKTKAAFAGGSGGGGADGAPESVQVAGVTLIARQVEGLDKDGLRALVDRHRDQIKSGVVVLAAPGRRQGAHRGRRHAGSRQEDSGRPGRQAAGADRRRRRGRAAPTSPKRRQGSVEDRELLAASRAVVEKLASA
jgi:alanyl-tRNA synthetase